MERSRNGTKKSGMGEKESEMVNTRMEEGTREKEEGTRAKKTRNPNSHLPPVISHRSPNHPKFLFLTVLILHTLLKPLAQYSFRAIVSLFLRFSVKELRWKTCRRRNTCFRTRGFKDKPCLEFVPPPGG